ncbi:cache domain-containing protein, partial [Eubacteriales bacterium OttesenSCG-928-N13]|nr:cache domain-containing protein [Eubacteriales bacterium OttesenSCG-928-N13]
MRIFKSVKTKIAAVVLFVMAALAVLLLVVNVGVIERYKALQTAQCQSMVDAESHKVNESIAVMENNVRKLAVIGQLLVESNGELDALGQQAVTQSFPEAAVAAGGGIFYAPHAVEAARQKLCFYAFRDERGEVVFDPSFESEAYDYLSQDWYVAIKAGALAGGDAPVWTAPYYDDAGTNALMTTVGFGLFDNGDFIGVATGDWVLTDIAESIAAIK